MNHELITVFTGEVANDCIPMCNARDLHGFLGVRRDFSTWIKNRIAEYGFVIDVDYITVQTLRSPNPGSAKARQQKVTDYHLTLDTAKELSMVERNEKGRVVRRYFIECEKKLQQINHPPSKRQQVPVFRYVITLHYRDVVTGQEETLSGGANTPEEIVRGTAKKFGIFIPEMLKMPVNAYY